MPKIHLAFMLFATSCAGAAVGQTWLANRLDWVEYSARQANNKAAKARDFEAFKNATYREPFEGGGYIVNGDVYLPDDAALLEFYLRGVMKNSDYGPALVIDKLGNFENLWPAADRTHLTYCVSKDFGSHYSQVVEAMSLAAKAWEKVAQVKFSHSVAEDPGCDKANPRVKFDVSPVNVSGNYLARAFFPNYPRQSRNLYIDSEAMKFGNSGTGLTLTGVLRHELGHTLGARHEHTRPESGACFEDNNWIPVTNYDAFSVMHYPQCKGLGDWTLNLTLMDQNGIACEYGPANGFIIDQSICKMRQG